MSNIDYLVHDIQSGEPKNVEAKADNLVMINGSEVFVEPHLALHFTIRHSDSNGLIEPSAWMPLVFIIVFALNNFSEANLQPSNDVGDTSSVGGKDDVIDFPKLLVGWLEVLLVYEVGLEALISQLELWSRWCPEWLTSQVTELQVRAPHKDDGFKVVLHNTKNEI